MRPNKIKGEITLLCGKDQSFARFFSNSTVAQWLEVDPGSALDQRSRKIVSKGTLGSKTTQLSSTNDPYLYIASSKFAEMKPLWPGPGHSSRENSSLSGGTVAGAVKSQHRCSTAKVDLFLRSWTGDSPGTPEWRRRCEKKCPYIAFHFGGASSS